jgi:membrane dipeptidase
MRRMRLAFVLLLCCACASTPRAVPTPEQRAIHDRALVMDAHCDITQDIVYSGYDFAARHTDHHEDLPRDGEGGLDAQLFSIWVDPEQFGKDRFFAEAEHQMLAMREKLSAIDGIALARTAREVRENAAQGRLSALFGVEGGHMLLPGDPQAQLAHLRRLSELGARYMTLTWSNSNDVGGSSGDEGRTQGLTPFGAQVIAEMERLGVVVDLSHVSDPLFWDAIRAAKKPVIASHSSARQLANVPRNLTDAQLEAIGKNGGAVCVNFFAGFLDAAVLDEIRADEDEIDRRAGRKLPAIEREHIFQKEYAERVRKVPLTTVADHIQHVAKIAGIDHVCLGSDFDGISMPPQGLEDATRLPELSAELLRRGMSEADLRKVLGENLLRVLEADEPR